MTVARERHSSSSGVAATLTRDERSRTGALLMKWWSWAILGVCGVVVWWSLLIFANVLFGIVASQGVFIGGIVVVCILALAIPMIKRG